MSVISRIDPNHIDSSHILGTNQKDSNDPRIDCASIGKSDLGGSCIIQNHPQQLSRFSLTLKAEDHPIFTTIESQPSIVATVISASSNTINFYEVHSDQLEMKESAHLIHKKSHNIFANISGIGLISLDNSLCLTILSSEFHFSINPLRNRFEIIKPIYLKSFKDSEKNYLNFANSNTCLCYDEKFCCNAFNIEDSALCVLLSNNKLFDGQQLQSQKSSLTDVCVPWKEINPEISSIVDMKFLNGYMDPTLLVLFKRRDIWDGSFSSNSDNLSMVAVSMNFVDKKLPVIYKIDKVPYDALYIVPSLSPLNGAVIICKNSFHYYSYGNAAFSISLNSCSFSTLYKRLSKLTFSLENSISFFVTKTQIISVAKNGEIYCFNFDVDSSNFVNAINVLKLSDNFEAPMSSSLISPNLLFYGSKSGIFLYEIKSAKRIKFINQDSIFFAHNTSKLHKYERKIGQQFHHQSTSFFQTGKLKSRLMIIKESECLNALSLLDLGNYSNFWSLYGQVSSESQIDLSAFHRYILLSNSAETIAIKISKEFLLIEESDFVTHEPTIAAFNIGPSNHILQATTSKLLLLEDTKSLDSSNIERGILNCKVCHEYCVLQNKSFGIEIYHIDIQAKKIIFKRDLDNFFPRVDCFATTNQFLASFSNNKSAKFDSLSKNKMSDINVEEILYGEINNDVKSKLNQQFTKDPNDKIPKNLHIFAIVKRTCLMIYDMHLNTIIFNSSYIDQRINILENNFSWTEYESKPNKNSSPDYFILDIHLVAYGKLSQKFDIIFITKTHIFSYSLCRSCQDSNSFTFIRNDLNVFSKNIGKEEFSAKDIISMNHPQKRVKFLFLVGKNAKFISYNNNGTRSNILHLESDNDLQRIQLFRNFNNDCNVAFLDSRNKFFMSNISILRNDIYFDKSFFYCYSIHNKIFESVVYFQNTDCFFTVSSSENCDSKLIKVMQESKEMEEYSIDDHFKRPDRRRYTIEVLDHESLRPVPDSRIDLPEHNKFFDCKSCHLLSKGVSDDPIEFIILAMNEVYGEELETRGYIEMYKIAFVVPKENIPLSQYSLKKLLREEQKGPISALCSINNLLCVALANRIFVFQLENNQALITVSFIDTFVFMNQITAIGNYIICSDIYASVILLRIDKYSKVLSLVSRDSSRKFSTVAKGIIGVTSNKTLDFWIFQCDIDGNLFLLSYDPYSKLSNGGRLLAIKGRCHFGSQIKNVSVTFSSQVNDSEDGLSVKNIISDSDNGAYHCVLVEENAFQRLLMLQISLNSYVYPFGGYNHKFFRLNLKGNDKIRSNVNLIAGPDKPILDGNILNQFLNLNSLEQEYIAKKIGSKVEIIIEDMKKFCYF